MHHPLSRLLSGGIVLGLLGCAPTVPAGQGDKALLIGINDYQNVGDLRGPHNDVQTMRETLIGQMGFQAEQIKELKDSEATRQGVLDAIDDWLIAGSRPGDRVVLYYSGHGHYLPDQNGDEKASLSNDDQDETLVVHDSTPTENQVLDDDIAERIQRLQGREVLALFDSCHSGTVTRGFDHDPEAKTPEWDMEAVATRGTEFDPVRQMEGNFIEGKHDNVAAFFAVAPNQLAIDDRTSEPNRPHGVFTQAFARGLAGGADHDKDGHVTYEELLVFIRSESNAFCQKYPNTKTCKTNKGELTPMLEIAPMKLAANIGKFGHAAEPSTPPPAPLAVTLFNHPGPAHLTLTMKSGPPTGGAMTPGTTFQPGHLLSYEITSDRSGKLVLFDIDATGEVTQLFPNGYVAGEIHRPDWINARDPVKIPGHFNFKLRVKKDLGPGKLIAVLIEDDASDINARIGQLTAIPPGQTFPTIADPARRLAEFRALLNQLFHAKDGSNRAIEWSMASVDYRVESKAP